MELSTLVEKQILDLLKKRNMALSFYEIYELLGIKHNDKVVYNIITKLSDENKIKPVFASTNSVKFILMPTYEDKELFKNDWVTVYERDGWYTFTKPNAELVCIVPYKSDVVDKPILGRFEICPAHADGLALTSITGHVEKGEKPIEAAVRELYEEAGYSLIPGNLIYLGSVMLSKQSEEICYLYSCNLSYQTKGKAKGDGTIGEEGAYCDWVSMADAIHSKDPCMQSIILRLDFKRY